MTEGNTGTTYASFTVSLSAASSHVVTVDFATADRTATSDHDYVATSGTVTFLPGQKTQTILVPVIGDRRGEPDYSETFLLNLLNPPNAFLPAESEKAQGQAKIFDDELRLSVAYGASVVEGNTGTKTVQVAVIAEGNYDIPVSIPFTTVDVSATTADKDYTAASGTLTFTPGGPSVLNVPVVIHAPPVPSSTRERPHASVTSTAGVYSSDTSNRPSDRRR